MPLSHDERWQLAVDLCARLVAAYPGQIILGGVYGSTARGTDTPWSDLELWFVTADGAGLEDQALESKALVYRDIAVGYQVHERCKLEQALSNPTTRWPFLMGVLSALHVLHGDPTLIDSWLDLGRAVPDEPFRVLLQHELPGLVIESYGRILSCRERGETDTLLASVWEVLLEMQLALCLLNRSWVTHDYRAGLLESTRFAMVPARYAELAPALWDAHEIDTVLPLATELCHNYLELLRQENIPLHNWQHVKEIPL